MRLTRVTVGAALAVALALGLGLGLMGQAMVASAQTTPAGEAGARSLASRFLDQLAAALGIERAALDTAMGDAADAALAAAVADGSLTQERAETLAARAQAGDFGALFGGRGGPGGRHGGPQVPGLRAAMVEAAAQELGMTPEELHAAIHSGQTLAELAAAAGTTEEALTEAALAAARSHLDAAVAAGTLSQAEADAIYADLEERGLFFGPGGRRGPPPATPDA